MRNDGLSTGTTHLPHNQMLAHKPKKTSTKILRYLDSVATQVKSSQDPHSHISDQTRSGSDFTGNTISKQNEVKIPQQTNMPYLCAEPGLGE